METIRTEWVDADGVTHATVSTRNVGESQEDFEARHDRVVAAAQALKPPVG